MISFESVYVFEHLSLILTVHHLVIARILLLFFSLRQSHVYVEFGVGDFEGVHRRLLVRAGNICE